ncbi:uncharacterized protein LOC105187502 [Harpegnathos saltator]|uniref:uncharacterized protein LOC105187502 n=1 Tax=Harpegnathos saltator TaxID=610380 RepID=UPI000DBED978|nr:uncharacterized protein LOC105187502 [Harpegnathos saltator]
MVYCVSGLQGNVIRQRPEIFCKVGIEVVEVKLVWRESKYSEAALPNLHFKSRRKEGIQFDLSNCEIEY